MLGFLQFFKQFCVFDVVIHQWPIVSADMLWFGEVPYYLAH